MRSQVVVRQFYPLIYICGAGSHPAQEVTTMTTLSVGKGTKLARRKLCDSVPGSTGRR